MAVARKVGEPIPIPEEIDVLEEDGKTIHILMLQVHVDVSEIKEIPEAMEAAHLQMVRALKQGATELEEKWLK